MNDLKEKNQFFFLFIVCSLIRQVVAPGAETEVGEPTAIPWGSIRTRRKRDGTQPNIWGTSPALATALGGRCCSERYQRGWRCCWQFHERANGQPSNLALSAFRSKAWPRALLQQWLGLDTECFHTGLWTSSWGQSWP